MPDTTSTWRVTSVLGMVQVLNWGSSYYLLAALASAIVADTGWSLPLVVGANSLALVMAALIAPLVGRRIAHLGGRTVLISSSLAMAIGLGLMGVAQNLAIYYLGWAIVGLGMGAGLYDALFATLAQMYRERARRPITTVTLFAGFASTVCWPLTSWLVSISSWREAVFCYACLHIFLSLPSIAWVLRGASTSSVHRSGTIPQQAVTLDAKDRLFMVLLVITLMVLGLLIAIASVHLITLLQSSGLTLVEAVAVGALIGPSQVVVRFVEIIGGGRQHPVWNLLICCSAMSLAMLLWWAEFPLPALAAVLYGISTGSYSIVRGTLPFALFGPQRYPILMGKMARPLLIAQAIGPIAGGSMISTFDGHATFSMLVALAALGLVLGLVLALLILRPQEIPEQKQK